MKADFLYDNFLVLYFVFLGAYFTLMALLTSKRKDRVKKSYRLLQQGLKDETISGKDDILLIYKCSRLPMSFVDYLEGFIFYLRNEKQVNVEDFIKINAFICEIVSEEWQEKPFEGIGQYEQFLLKSIDEIVENENKNKTLIRNSLTQLAMSIEKSQKKIRQLRRKNMWSIAFSIISVIITIWFGVKSVSKKDLEAMKNDTTSPLIEVNESSMRESGAVGDEERGVEVADRSQAQ